MQEVINQLLSLGIKQEAHVITALSSDTPLSVATPLTELKTVLSEGQVLEVTTQLAYIANDKAAAGSPEAHAKNFYYQLLLTDAKDFSTAVTSSLNIGD